MKRIILSASILASLGFVALTQHSCVKDIAKDLFNEFVTDPQTASFTIPIITSTSAPFGTIDSVLLDANINAEIQSKTGGQFTLDDVDAIYLESIRFELDGSADVDNNWQNFEQLGFDIVSNTGAGPTTMGPFNVPDTYSTNLQLNDINKTINIKSHLSGTGAIYYIMKGKARKTTNKPLTGTMYITFKIV